MSNDTEYLPGVSASILVQMHKPTALVGIPGTVKTVFLNELAKYLTKLTNEEWAFESFVGPQMQVEEMTGVLCPDRVRGVTDQLPLVKLHRLSQAQKGVCFIDELNLTNKSVGAALMTFIQDRRAGSITVSPEISMVAAINPEWASASARRFSAPEANRLTFLPWVTGPGADSDEDIYKEAGLAYKRARANYLRGGPGLFSSLKLLPANWRDFQGQARAMLVAFEDKFPEFTDERSLPDENKQDDGSRDRSVSKYATCQAWASSRSLETGADILAALLSMKVSPTGALARMMLTGAMGETASTAFRGWVKDLQFPPADEMLDQATPDQIRMIIQALRVDFQRLCLDALSAAASVKTHPQYKERWHKQQEVLEGVYKVRQDIALTAMEILARGRRRDFKLSDVWTEHYKTQNLLMPEPGL